LSSRRTAQHNLCLRPARARRDSLLYERRWKATRARAGWRGRIVARPRGQPDQVHLSTAPSRDPWPRDPLQQPLLRPFLGRRLLPRQLQRDTLSPSASTSHCERWHFGKLCVYLKASAAVSGLPPCHGLESQPFTGLSHARLPHSCDASGEDFPRNNQPSHETHHLSGCSTGHVSRDARQHRDAQDRGARRIRSPIPLKLPHHAKAPDFR
jgi:hypothetical protein